MSIDESAVLSALRTVLDPEVGVNVVDLGLIHQVEVTGRHVRVVLLLPSPISPLREVFLDEARAAVGLRLPLVTGMTIETVTEPRWTEARMTDAARWALGLTA